MRNAKSSFLVQPIPEEELDRFAITERGFRYLMVAVCLFFLFRVFASL